MSDRIPVLQFLFGQVSETEGTEGGSKVNDPSIFPSSGFIFTDCICISSLIVPFDGDNFPPGLTHPISAIACDDNVTFAVLFPSSFALYFTVILISGFFTISGVHEKCGFAAQLVVIKEFRVKSSAILRAINNACRIIP